MKEKSITMLSVAVIAFIIGMLFNDSMQMQETNDYDYKRVIEVQNEALNKAEYIIDKHNIYDVEGGDVIVEYMDALDEANNLYNKINNK